MGGSAGESLFPSGGFTMRMRLCDDAGMVTGEIYTGILNRLRGMSGHKAYVGEPFPCTGSAHLAGEHICCTSPAHSELSEKAVDALPERPDRIEEPLPEDLERLLRDPEIAVSQDVAVHSVIRRHLRANPEATVTRNAYLNLWALIETGAFND